jgi:ATP-dependent helicase HrpA
MLNYLRVREWQDLFGQLSQVADEMQLPLNTQSADYQRIHSAILTGLLGQIGTKDVDADYLGPRQSRFYVFPGSGLFKKKPKWVMAAELVETSRLYARTLARIEPEWVEPVAQHLVNRSYAEPHWEKKRGAVIAYEQVSLYGLILVGKRPVLYSKIDEALCHQLFIREALVGGELGLNESFLQHNARLIEHVSELEDKSRRRDILVDEETLASFYAEKIPQHANNRIDFTKWWRAQQKLDPQYLNFDPDKLKRHGAAHITDDMYPEFWRQGNLTLPLEYHFSPGAPDDGVSLIIPVALLNQVVDEGFDWLIPGLRHELLVALIKSLPKVIRRNFVPAPNYADALLQAIKPEDGSLITTISNRLKRMSGMTIPEDSWDLTGIDAHLKFNFKVVDDKQNVLKQGRSLGLLKQQMQGKVQETLSQVAEQGIEQEQLTDWTFGDLPKAYIKVQSGYEIKAFPALIDQKDSVAIRLLDSPEQARATSQAGLRRLLLLNLPSPIKYLQDSLPNKAKLGLYFNPFGKVLELIDDCISAAIDTLINSQPWPETPDDFKSLREHVRAELGDTVVTIALKVEQILTIGHEISKKLRGRLDFALAYANADIKAQLDLLLFKGFVTGHGAAKLDDLKRYLTALQKRLEKLPADPQRDRLQMLEYQKAYDAYQQLLGKFSGKPLPSEVVAIRWMLEELKVSLFAQQLGTPYPISSKRIVQAVQELK